MSDQFIQINPIQADVWFTQNCQGGAVIYVSLICKYEKFQILIAISRLTKICKNKQFLKYDKFNIFEKPYATANFQKLNIKKK